MKSASVSEHIAPEMVAIDDHSNGWRQLVLPLAWMNDMVLNSVAAVAAFHLSERISVSHYPAKRTVPGLSDPAILYSKAILELQKRRDLHNTNQEARRQVIVAILVLLLATMVNGSSDFMIIFHMLQSAVGFVGGEETLAANGDDFLAIQIRKYELDLRLRLSIANTTLTECAYTPRPSSAKPWESTLSQSRSTSAGTVLQCTSSRNERPGTPMSSSLASGSLRSRSTSNGRTQPR